VPWRAWLLTVVGGAGVGLLLAGGVLLAEARQAVTAWRAAPAPGRPTTVLSAPMRLRSGEPHTVAALTADLLAAGYESAPAADKPDRFVIEGETLKIWSAARVVAGISLAEVKGELQLSAGHITRTAPAAGLRLRPTVLGVAGDLSTRRTPVRLAELSPWMVPALLSIEDTRFRDHPGIDPVGLARAAWHTLRDDGLQGGSTLTQQLAKNLFLGQERTVRRKVRELFLALALEQTVDKDELLELYLSEVYLGHAAGVPVHGVEQAARTWFGHGAGSLSVAEAATIAGVIASPNQLSPLRDLDACRVRRDVVIDRMVAVHALTVEQATAAHAEALAVLPPSVGASWRSPWVVAAALDEAAGAMGDGFRPDGGLTLHTSAQPHLQRSAEASLTASLKALGADHPEALDAEGALAAVSVADGAIVALVGGRDWLKSPFHRARDAWREAGSTVKPLVALAALEANRALTPASALSDTPITLVHDGTSWTPRNYDGRYLGPVPLGLALENSRNLPFVRLAEGLGWSTLQRRLQEAGLSKATDFPSASLGGSPTTVVELAGAYTAFPGRGTAQRPWLLRAAVDTAGVTVWEHSPASRRLAGATSTALVRHHLERVLTDGTGRRAESLGLTGAVGAKTGTTDAGRDAWLVGFDPELSVAVWVGLDRGTLGLTGGEAALPAWVAFLRDIAAPRGRFADPDDVIATPVCADDLLPPCSTCAEVHTGWFPRGRVPAADCAKPRPAAEPAPAEAPSPAAAPTPGPATPAPSPPEPTREAPSSP
jgi:membrane peptidoglycan carboxypeptidase